ncbi:MAG: hypothetical protein Q7R66_10930 [Undibacterium sp.]|uniref:hypothetical protein n=1 Tax=Undibacterium sp. TaxID=1914977 RepID=UPI00271629F4|nr:hypothetical protein [Undibacterium sp.]MDO8652695.1 hypothetical protein [Undibacterium sp.]
MTKHEPWNRCRFVPNSQKGHYESYFLRANHPERPRAFWIRYTIFSPEGRPGNAVGELWAIYFDGETKRITAVKEVLPVNQCGFPDGELNLLIGSATLTEDFLQGKANSRGNSMQWALRYEGGQAPILLLPQSFYERAFPKAKALVGRPNVQFHGALTVNGETIPIDRWQGSQNHNWGSKHTDSYAWGQVAGFDNAPDAFLECSTARLRIGPIWTPAFTLLVLRTDEGEIALNNIAQAVRAKGRFNLHPDCYDWHIESRTADVRVSIHIHAKPSSFVGLKYDNPPGGVKTCLNTKLAACKLTLERAGRASRTLITRDRAAFEILTEKTNHQIAIVA